MPTITKKAAWAIKWIGANVPYGLRLAAFSIVEGVFFSGSFCAIQWLNHRGKMPSLCQSNEFISRDENQHTELAAMLYGHIQNRVPRDIIEMMFREAVEIEKDFVCNALPVSLIEMNQALMCAHIEYTADYLLVQLGYPKIWNTPEPFDFMRLMTMSGKTNFFERGVTEYRKFGVGAEKVEDPFAPIDI
jgi:ribonucleotide reductase beta subunit family protein with ferritin-like domain